MLSDDHYFNCWNIVLADMQTLLAPVSRNLEKKLAADLPDVSLNVFIYIKYSKICSIFCFCEILNYRFTRESVRFKDDLDIMKFICKDFWGAVFKKQVDNLRTNHQVSKHVLPPLVLCLHCILHKCNCISLFYVFRKICIFLRIKMRFLFSWIICWKGLLLLVCLFGGT